MVQVPSGLTAQIYASAAYVHYNIQFSGLLRLCQVSEIGRACTNLSRLLCAHFDCNLIIVDNFAREHLLAFETFARLRSTLCDLRCTQSGHCLFEGCRMLMLSVCVIVILFVCFFLFSPIVLQLLPLLLTEIYFVWQIKKLSLNHLLIETFVCFTSCFYYIFN